MNTRKAAVGRPRTITPERLLAAGIEIGLPHLSMLGMAAALAVSPTALYRHFARLGDLKQYIAQEMFLRWPLPPVFASGQQIDPYLMQLSANMWELVERHPGFSPYLLRTDLLTRAMLDKVAAHHQDVAQAFGLPLAQVQWLLSTVTYHSVAVADTLLPLPMQVPRTPVEAHWLHVAGVPASAASYARLIRERYDQGARAMIVGALAVMEEGERVATASCPGGGTPG